MMLFESVRVVQSGTAKWAGRKYKKKFRLFGGAA